jgi:hypothetical protein
VDADVGQTWNSVVRQSVILVASRGRRRRWLILPPAAVPQPDYPLRGCHWRPHLATVDRSTEAIVDGEGGYLVRLWDVEARPMKRQA